MSPNDASVYTDSWSSTTWVLVLTGMIFFVMAMMGLFIAMVHRAGEVVGAVRTDEAADRTLSRGGPSIPRQAAPGAGGARAVPPSEAQGSPSAPARVPDTASRT